MVYVCAYVPLCVLWYVYVHPCVSVYIYVAAAKVLIGTPKQEKNVKLKSLFCKLDKMMKKEVSNLQLLVILGALKRNKTKGSGNHNLMVS